MSLREGIDGEPGPSKQPGSERSRDGAAAVLCGRNRGVPAFPDPGAGRTSDAAIRFGRAGDLTDLDAAIRAHQAAAEAAGGQAAFEINL